MKTPKTEIIRARVTKAEKADLLKAASGVGTDLSNFIRLKLGLK